MLSSRLRRPADRAVLLVLMVVVILHQTLPIGGTPEGRAVLGTKVKRESDARQASPAEENDSSEEVIYDQRQVNGETNIRLNIKNFQLRLPESQLDRFQPSDMAQLIRNSVLQLFGIPVPVDASSGGPPSMKRPQQEPAEHQLPEQQPTQQQSMLQVNGNNLPAKFFLEISDFLMNTNDNDAVDDKRVETNHNQQQQQQQQTKVLQPAEASPALYAMEEIKIERVENSNSVKNETITISKKMQHLAPVPPNGTALETVRTENRSSSNATRNATANEDRFVQTKPIRLDTVVVRIETEGQTAPKTLREKVIWRMPPTEGRPERVAGE